MLANCGQSVCVCVEQCPLTSLHWHCLLHCLPPSSPAASWSPAVLCSSSRLSTHPLKHKQTQTHTDRVLRERDTGSFSSRWILLWDATLCCQCYQFCCLGESQIGALSRSLSPCTRNFCIGSASSSSTGRVPPTDSFSVCVSVPSPFTPLSVGISSAFL